MDNSGKTQISNPELSRLFERILITQEKLKELVANEIIWPRPLIEKDNQGLFYPNTINIIQGQSGSHKSRVAELLCSCLLNNSTEKLFAGFNKCDSVEGTEILYVDTERNVKEQYPAALQKIKKLAGYSKDDSISNFEYISLNQIPRESRFDLLKLYIESKRKKSTAHIVIVLDVLTDLILSFNDPKESLKLTDYMNSLINDHDVTFISVIHENPGAGEKARGHLGTEALNKASLQIQVGFVKDKSNQNTDLIKLAFKKVRTGRVPQPFYLAFSEQEKTLKLADEEFVNSIIAERRFKASLTDMEKELLERLTVPKSRTELFKELTDHFECSENTIDSRIKEFIDRKTAIKDNTGVKYILLKEKKGKEIFFRLEKHDNLLSF